MTSSHERNLCLGCTMLQKQTSSPTSSGTESALNRNHAYNGDLQNMDAFVSRQIQTGMGKKTL